MMELHFHKKYVKYSDEEIVDSIVKPPHNEEVAAYLIYNRYAPLFKNIYRKVFENDPSWYGDCLNDLYLFLRGKDLEWNKLKTFEWKSKLGTWLSKIAYNRFLEIKPILIGKMKNIVYIDDNYDNKTSLQIPNDDEQDYERRERNVLLLEAISMLEDPDQKFVILKRLQGYNSKEIALLMQKRWEKHDVVKYNKKKQIIVPDAAYVDVKVQRAKDNLEKILEKLR